MSEFKAISLFTGAGGLDYGFEAAGFTTSVALELDLRCVETLRQNRAWPVIAEDLARVPTPRLLAVAGLEVGEADVLIGGPPCQPFSKSGFWVTGTAGRLDDPRSSTLDGYLRVLAEARPRAFLIENVEGLGFRGKDEGLRLITARLDEINAQHGTHYTASVAVLNAADYGVPQFRRRMFIIGARSGARFKFPAPSHIASEAGDRTDNRPRYATAWDALHDLRENLDESVVLRGKWADLFPSIPEGQNYLWHTERGGGEPLFGWRRRYWSFLLKLAKTQPSWTIQAQPGPATGPFHWSNRKLTVREMARLQTFPDNLTIAGNYADAQRQLGNAVPSLLGEVLARAIARQLLGARDLSGFPRLLVGTAMVPPPDPEQVAAVPARYLALKGLHAAHPGTGRGYRALSRSTVPA
jgi:DNA (cytosine-5)-methyltransferase 1